MSLRFERTSGFRFVQNAVNLYKSDKIVDLALVGGGVRSCTGVDRRSEVVRRTAY